MTCRLQKGLIALGLFLGGCATVPQPPPEAIVAQRALARWQALIKGEFEKAYHHYSPGFRKATSLKEFTLAKSKGVGVWQAARVERVTCSKEDLCTAVVRVKTRFFHPRFGKLESESPVEERWVYKEGQWWYVPK